VDPLDLFKAVSGFKGRRKWDYVPILFALLVYVLLRLVDRYV
jgi:hypothetical protein